MAVAQNTKLKTYREEDEAWNDLIAQFHEIDVPALVEVAQERRAQGQSIVSFCEEAIEAFEICRQRDELNKVFELSSRDGGNLSQAAIEAALEHIKAGGTAAEAYERTKAFKQARRRLKSRRTRCALPRSTASQPAWSPAPV